MRSQTVSLASHKGATFTRTFHRRGIPSAKGFLEIAGVAFGVIFFIFTLTGMSIAAHSPSNDGDTAAAFAAYEFPADE